MDYNARYYSPYLNRFVQADTIIPSAGDPQSWDRYAYVRNNPINRVDPTGHMECYDDGSNGCGGRQADALLNEFDIKVNGLTLKQKWTMLAAASLFGEKLKGEGMSVIDSFRQAEGPIKIDVGSGIGPDPKTGNCITVTGNISCNSVPDLQTIIHEMIHVFDLYYKAIANDNEHLASDYFPREWVDTTSGYKCKTIDCLAHPPNLLVMMLRGIC